MFLFHFHGTVFKAVSLFSQLWQKQLKGERICFGSQFVGGGEGTVLGCELLTLHPESGGRDGYWCSACFILHLPGLQSFSPWLTLEDPHSHAQRSISWVALDPVKVTISIIIQTKAQLIDRVLSLYRSKTLHWDGHGTGCPKTQCHFRRRTNEQNSKITPCWLSISPHFTQRGV